MSDEDIRNEIIEEIREEIRREREEIRQEITKEVTPCAIQLHLLSKEIIQGREEYLNLLKSQDEINREEIRNAILHERRERGHSMILQESTVPNTKETETSSPSETPQQRNEFLSLLNSQHQEDRVSVDVTELESAPEETHQQRRRNRRSSAIWSLVGVRSFSPLSDGLNTGTIYMYAVALVVNPSVHKLRSWAFVIGALCFTLLEIFVLSSLVSDLYDGEKYDVRDVSWKIFSGPEDEDKKCGDIGGLSNTEKILIAFLSILWMLPLIQDIEEASTEEKVMEHHLNDDIKGCAEVLRFSLRIR